MLYLCCACVLAIVQPAYGNAELSDSASIELASALEFQVSALPVNAMAHSSEGWEPVTGQRVNLGFTDDAIWFRAQISNPTENTRWYLTLSNTRLDRVEFYLVTDEGTESFVAGDRITHTDPLSAMPTFEFTLPKQASAVLLMRIHSETQVAFFPTIRGSYKYGEYRAYRTHLHYFYIALLVFFTLSQFSVNRAPFSALNAYYGAGLLFAFLYLFLYYGEGNAILWPGSVFLKNHMHFVSASLSFLSFTLFLQCYLRTRVSTPNLHRVFKLFAGFCGAFAVVMVFPIPNIIMVHIILVESAAISILAVVGTVRCIQVGNRWALGLAIPLVCSVVALIVYALTFLSVLPFTQFTSNLILWSLPLDILMVSGSFVYRHLQLQKENRELLERLRGKALQSESARAQSSSRLNNVDEDLVLNNLVDFLDEKKAFLESGLTLDDVAKAIEVRPDQLSAVINSRLNTSFSTLLNLKRLNAAAALLIAEKDSSILDVSLRCGFGSKSSFNRLFKEQFDTTPSQYRKLIGYNRENDSDEPVSLT